jgi:hypothetical protein
LLRKKSKEYPLYFTPFEFPEEQTPKARQQLKLLEQSYRLRLNFFCHFYDMTAQSACSYSSENAVETKIVPFDII